MARFQILENVRLRGDYFRVVFSAPEIAAAARAGQFVHVRIDERRDHVLRRPFSIHDADPAAGSITLIYKRVGSGTALLAEKAAGSCCDLLGPLGTAFTPAPEGVVPVAVAGGYGAAATYMLVRSCARKPVLLIGARNRDELILDDVYRAAGCDVRVATDDGGCGVKGRVTELVEPLLAENPGKKFFFYGCGPRPMLAALGRKLRELHRDGELSVDEIMCCGVGACFGCVVKINDPDAEKGWSYARSCVEGPVFPLEKIYLEK
ncbi:MAG: dihydroorotate dehydrogenase electron transfer subunit [Victivallaceae bacterium]|nr:dihydroorotate dehydrogenase electron transfer subunit [Victivallaceae bacterium]